MMQSNKDFKPTPSYLREVVLDYLLHNSYVDTARAFAEDSASVNSLGGTVGHTESHSSGDGAQPKEPVANGGFDIDESMEGCDSGGDEDTHAGSLSKEIIRIARQRQEIRIHILSGRVEEAMRLLNLHFPQVLREPDGSSVSLAKPPSSRFGSSKIEILNPADAPEMEQQPRKLQFTSTLSLHPTHISLNLRIQDFIESVRTIPLLYPHSKYSSPADEPSSSVAYTNGSLSHPISTSTPTKLTPDQRVVLHKAQRLYSTAQSLSNQQDQSLYLEEVKNVGGLLAYLVPEESSISTYLSQQRREAVANQVNGAILYHLGKPAVSCLELYTRYTTAVWKLMHDMRLPSPQGQSSSDSAPSAPVANRKLGVLKNERDEVEIVRPFDLGEFLGP